MRAEDRQDGGREPRAEGRGIQTPYTWQMNVEWMLRFKHKLIATKQLTIVYISCKSYNTFESPSFQNQSNKLSFKSADRFLYVWRIGHHKQIKLYWRGMWSVLLFKNTFKNEWRSKYNFDTIYLCQFFTYCQCSL